MVSKKPEILILEVDKRDVPTQEESKEAIEALSSLNGHPGFEEILRKFRFAQAQLQARLNAGGHETLRDVDNLTTGMRWLGFAEKLVRSAAKKRDDAQRKPRAPYADEMEEFERLSKFVNIVGRKEQVV